MFQNPLMQPRIKDPNCDAGEPKVTWRLTLDCQVSTYFAGKLLDGRAATFAIIIEHFLECEAKGTGQSVALTRTTVDKIESQNRCIAIFCLRQTNSTIPSHPMSSLIQCSNRPRLCMVQGIKLCFYAIACPDSLSNAR